MAWAKLMKPQKKHMLIWRPFVLLIGFIALAALCSGERPSPLPDETPLQVAQRLAQTKLRGFTYGHDLKKHQIDCVQFLVVVVEELLGRRLTKSESDILCINYEFADLKKAVAQGDPRTQGILRALTESLKCGKPVNLRDVRPGDFIQYWYENRQGDCLGHAAIVSRVLRNDPSGVCVALYGSHKATNGVAETVFDGEGLILTKPGRHIYLVRFNPHKTE